MGLFRFDLESEKQTTSVRMQMGFRGISESYMLNVEDGQKVSLGEVAAAVAEHEGADDVLLYVNGRPLDMEMAAEELENCTVDVSVPLREERCTDPWLVPVRCAVRPPRLRPKKRKRRRQEGPRGG